MTSTDAQVRRMKQQDVDAVVKIAASLPSAPHWPLAAYLHALEEPRIALVAERWGELLGFAVASVVGNEAELETIAVAWVEQNRGVARRLFAELAEEVKLAGAATIILEVRESNRPALVLYYSLGFEEIGRRPRYYVDPVEDAVLMEMSLGQAAPARS
jgi:[ribosomal protein S18]-alanine N-acetyltransferase